MDAFWNYIRSLQQKPERERRGIAIASSITIALLVGIIFFGSSVFFGTSSGTSAAAEMGAIDSPAGVIAREFWSAAATIKQGMIQISEAISSFGKSEK